MSAKIPIDQMTLEQLEHARMITQSILTDHMGASQEVDREIVEKARIRLSMLTHAIEDRKRTLAIEDRHRDDGETGPRPAAPPSSAVRPHVPPGGESHPDDSPFKQATSVEDSQEPRSWKVGGPW